jgi:CDP-diglyceride synthetase
MLKQRLIAAALGLPMLFVLLWLNWFLRNQGSTDDLPILGIVLLIAGASGWEVSRVVRHRFPYASSVNGLYAALIIPFIVHAVRMLPTSHGLAPVSSLGLLIDSLGATACMMMLFLGAWGDVEHRGWTGVRENVVVVLAGLYLGVTTSILLLLGETRWHELALAFLFVGVFGLDTAAYFAGKYIGGPQIAPHVSPKKTLTGSVAGLMAAMLLALVFLGIPGVPGGDALYARVQWWEFAVLGLAIGVFGQIGDLMESAFKRWGGVKDAGFVIPGHGGFLDRFDSLFLAAPVFFLLLRFFS